MPEQSRFYVVHLPVTGRRWSGDNTDIFVPRTLNWNSQPLNVMILVRVEDVSLVEQHAVAGSHFRVRGKALCLQDLVAANTHVHKYDLSQSSTSKALSVEYDDPLIRISVLPSFLYRNYFLLSCHRRSVELGEVCSRWSSVPPVRMMCNSLI